MARWFPSFNRKAEGYTASATVPLVNDLSGVVYPDDNYSNYAIVGPAPGVPGPANETTFHP